MRHPNPCPSPDERRSPPDPPRQLLRTWVGLVHDAAGRRLTLGEAEYRALHRELLAACDARAAQPALPDAAHWARMADRVRPFLDARSLARTDPEILIGLAQECGEPGSRANRARSRPRSRTGLTGVLVRLVLVAVTLVLLMQVESLRLATWHGVATVLATLRSWLSRYGLGPGQVLAVLAILAGALQVVSKTSTR